LQKAGKVDLALNCYIVELALVMFRSVKQQVKFRTLHMDVLVIFDILVIFLMLDAK